MMADRVIFICTIVIAVVYLYATTLIPSLEIGDPLGPKAFPRLLGVAMLFGAALLGFEMWKQRRSAQPSDTGSQFEWPVVKVLGSVVIWTALYYASFQKAGYIVATSVYLLGLMVFFHPGKWIANVLSSIGFAALTYWLFATLDVNLPKGFLPF